jgi:hypothetical protein
VVALAAEEKLDRAVVPYLKRLADFLFVLGRWVNHKAGGTETTWINPSGTDQGLKPDKLSASLQKLEEEKKRRQSLFEKTASQLQKKKEEAEKNFLDGVDQIKKEGGQVEKPLRDIDLG